jgi:hypothetical protein
MDMKKILFISGVMVLSVVGISQKNYPIKTIYKGDSVIIITPKQSDLINHTLDENLKTIKQNKSKIQDLTNQINSKDSIINQLQNEKSDILDSLWVWSAGPCMIYTQYPDDSTLYILDLSHYYMTTDDYGIIMPKMSEKEYNYYKNMVIRERNKKEEGLNMFKTESRILYLPVDVVSRKKVWKYKSKGPQKK